VTTRVLLADDHAMFRQALRGLIAREAGFEVVAEAGDGLAVLALARATTPDLVVMDIGMPGLNGIEATRQLLAANPRVKVVALSAYSDKGFVTEMLAAGAKGYVLKAAAAETLLDAIRVVAHDGTYLCPEIMATVVDAARGAQSDKEEGRGRLGRRERQVLQLIATGNTSPEIAARLHIAPSTVDVHRRNIMHKLGLHTVADLTRWAIRHGLVSAE
jgi:DNA-binding NarL/FixJ family response regulator